MLEVINSVMRLFKMEMTINGFTFSFWDMFLLSWILGIVAYVINRIFGD